MKSSNKRLAWGSALKSTKRRHVQVTSMMSPPLSNDCIPSLGYLGFVNCRPNVQCVVGTNVYLQLDALVYSEEKSTRKVKGHWNLSTGQIENSCIYCVSFDGRPIRLLPNISWRARLLMERMCKVKDDVTSSGSLGSIRRDPLWQRSLLTCLFCARLRWLWRPLDS